MMAKDELSVLLESITTTTDGLVGIYAQHLQSDFYYQQNANQYFFMASIFKILIAVHCLKLVEQKVLDLAEFIEVFPTDVRPYGVLDRHYHYPGVMLSFNNLLQLMLQVSDNTATDVILKLVGGPKAVMATFVDPAFKEINFTHSCLHLLLQQAGVEDLADNEDCTLEQLNHLINIVPSAKSKQAALLFSQNPPNTATPHIIAELLIQIQQHSILSENSAKLLISWMRHCRTGLTRMRALLPVNTLVADKTGTLTDVTNNAGIIELPNNKGQLILVIFIKESTKPRENDEKVIAQIARTLFDYIMFTQ